MVEGAVPTPGVILVGILALLEPPSPHRPASLVSKKPNTEKSPCVIVALAAEVHSVAIPAHAAINRFRQHTPRPTPVLLFTICSPKPTAIFGDRLAPTRNNSVHRTQFITGTLTRPR